MASGIGGNPVTRVEVKREHIDRGDPGLCQSCAITRAIRDIVRDDIRVATQKTVVVMFDKSNPGGSRKDLGLPVEARQFISLYDDCETDEDKAKVNPIAFDLDIPAEFLKGDQ